MSIILPVRNGARHLPAALASIRAQTESSWELIVVNDGSADETASQLEAAAREDRRIHIVTTPPLGIVHALNLALAQVQAPLIARMDADDVADPQRLQKQCAFLDAHPGIGLVSCLVRFGQSTSPAGGYERHVRWLNSVREPDAIRRRRFVESPFAHPSVVYRRRVVEEHGAYRDGEFPEDYELWLRWQENGVAMSKLPEELLIWNDSPGRLSRNNSRYAFEAFYRLKADYLARWLGIHLSAERSVWVWGAGRVTRHRVAYLIEVGVRVAGWIDIDPRKCGKIHEGVAVHPPDVLCRTRSAFVLAYVGSWNARETIAGWLHRNGFEEERDYLLCA